VNSKPADDQVSSRPEMQLSCWRDIRTAQSEVLSACIGVPITTAVLIFISAVSAVMPYKLARGMGWASIIVVSAIACRLIPDVWAKLNETERQDTKVDLARLPSLIAISFLYPLGCMLGLMLFIIPGVIAIVCGNLAVAIACIEKRGPLDSFIRSDRLIRGHFWRTIRYLAPVLVCSIVLGYLVYAGAILTLDPESMEIAVDQSPVMTGHAISSVIAFVYCLFLHWLILSLLPLQVRLYRFLHQMQKK
jgi:hypothetical protein